MQKLKILNTREKKQMLENLRDNYGFEQLLEGVFFQSQDNDIYLLTGGFEFIEQGKEKELRIDKAGLYLGRIRPGGVEMSIEGSQLIGPGAKKNVLEISDEQLELWVKGEGLELDEPLQEGYYLIKHKKDFVGCAKLKNRIAKNLLDKNRLLKVLNK